MEKKSSDDKSGDVGGYSIDEWSSVIEKESTTRATATDPRKLFVNNIPYSIHERALESLFSEFGSLDEVSIWRERETKSHMGKATLGFRTDADASKCLEAARSQRGLWIGDNRLLVDYLKRNPRNTQQTRKKTPSGDGGASWRAFQAGSSSSTTDRRSNESDERNRQRDDDDVADSSLTGVHVNDLPYHVFISIFAHLGIRDLCTVEKGSLIVYF